MADMWYDDLSDAQSRMHWTAAMGTWYQIEGYHDGQELDKNTNLIVAYCLVSFVLIGVIFCLQKSVNKFLLGMCHPVVY
jgi:hypothetical protein